MIMGMGDGDDDGNVKDMMCFMLQIAAVKPNVLCQIQVACEMLNNSCGFASSSLIIIFYLTSTSWINIACGIFFD